MSDKIRLQSTLRKFSKLGFLVRAIHRMAGARRVQLYVACVILLAVAMLEGTLIIVMATIVTNILGSSEVPPVFQKIVGALGIQNKPGFDVQSLLVLIAGLMLRETMTGLSKSYLYLITPGIITSIMERLLSNVLNAQFTYLDRYESGTFRQVLINASGKTVVAAQSIVMFLGHVTSMAIVFALMVYSSPILTLIIIVVAVFVIPLRLLFARFLHRFERESLERMFDFHNTLHEIVVNMKLIKLVGMVSKFKDKALDIAHRTMWLRAYSVLMSTWDTLFVYVATMLVIGALLLSNESFAIISTEQLIAFLVIVYRMVPPTVAASTALNRVIANEPHVIAAKQFYDPEDGRREREGGTAMPDGPVDAIELQDLSFSYTGSNPALRNVTLEARRGEITAIVGKSGSGKSSIVNLLLGMYERDSGALLLRGPNGPLDIDEIELTGLRSAIGVVTQDVTLLNTSIREVIRSSDPTVTDEEVVDAAKRADAHAFIIGTPHGYDTLVGERGVMLSGGQRQRLLIAQILALRTRVLILDEATSALDTFSERNVHQTLRQLKSDCLIIVITHRFSSLQEFDRIFVLKENTVCESGSWAELMESQDALYEMVKSSQHNSEKEEE